MRAWFERKAFWFVLVGVFVSAAANGVHNYLDDETNSKNAVSSELDNYQRLVSLHRSTSGDSIAEMFRLSTESAPDLEKLIRAVPIIDKQRRECIDVFGGLDKVARVTSDQMDDDRILYETGIALRLELSYQSITVRAHGNFTAVPANTDAADLHDLTTLTNTYVRA